MVNFSNDKLSKTNYDMIYLNPLDDRITQLNGENNVYVSKILSSDSTEVNPILFGNLLKNKKGNWRSYFAKTFNRIENSRCIVEIGCHKGRSLLEMAELFPEIDFVGIDITLKRVYLTAKRAAKKGLKNVVSVLADARGVQDIFSNKEIAGVMIFFPDPFAKKARQQKNRLLDYNFFNSIRNILITNGFVWLKTDQVDYFNIANKALQDNDFTAYRGVGSFLETKICTVFEEKFTLQNLPCYESKFLYNKL